jgi:uracil-DNA glycosylase
VTKCYPGKRPDGWGDRLPTAAERALCRSWQEQELALIQPRLIIPLGRIAIEQFLPALKGQPLASFIGQQFEAQGAVIVPLPHPSGRSRWLNQPEHQSLLERALARLHHLRETLSRAA